MMGRAKRNRTGRLIAIVVILLIISLSGLVYLFPEGMRLSAGLDWGVNFKWLTSVDYSLTDKGVELVISDLVTHHGLQGISDPSIRFLHIIFIDEQFVGWYNQSLRQVRWQTRIHPIHLDFPYSRFGGGWHSIRVATYSTGLVDSVSISGGESVRNPSCPDGFYRFSVSHSLLDEYWHSNIPCEGLIKGSNPYYTMVNNGAEFIETTKRFYIDFPECPSQCVGGVSKTEGVFSMGQCNYQSYVCEYGCAPDTGRCNPPPTPPPPDDDELLIIFLIVFLVVCISFVIWLLIKQYGQ